MIDRYVVVRNEEGRKLSGSVEDGVVFTQKPDGIMSVGGVIAMTLWCR